MIELKRTRITPRPGFKLRDPQTGKLIPSEGIVVRGVVGSFWHLLKKEGAVDMSDEPAKSTAPEQLATEPATTAEPASASRVEE